LTHPGQLGPEHVIQRVSSTEVRSLAALHPWVKPNALVDGSAIEHQVFRLFWDLADPDSFNAPLSMVSLRASKML
jgi:hypothetical protein